jgi:cardiolipin synthase
LVTCSYAKPCLTVYRAKAAESRKPLLKVLTQFTPHENIYTIPNILTLSRLVAAPVIGYLVLHDYHAWAVGLFAYAGITDLVDGYIARRWNLQTVVGTVIDPMADKILMTILTVCLAVKGALPGSGSRLPFLDFGSDFA